MKTLFEILNKAYKSLALKGVEPYFYSQISKTDPKRYNRYIEFIRKAVRGELTPADHRYSINLGRRPSLWEAADAYARDFKKGQKFLAKRGITASSNEGIRANLIYASNKKVNSIYDTDLLPEYHRTFVSPQQKVAQAYEGTNITKDELGQYQVLLKSDYFKSLPRDIRKLVIRNLDTINEPT